MTDANLLAVEAAQESVRRLWESVDHGGSSLPPIDVFASDVFSAVGEERYDLIASNPPFHRGKTIDYTVADRLITEAPEHLADDGSLLIVANAFLAYGKRMERVFATVETIAATRQYHVLRASQPRVRQFAGGGMKPKPV
jgi:16S rRNA (guanine1207-N2)-methyltransferase